VIKALAKIAEAAHMAASGSEYLDTQRDEEESEHAAETYQMVCPKSTNWPPRRRGSSIKSSNVERSRWRLWQVSKPAIHYSPSSVGRWSSIGDQVLWEE
jgi:hypothetical protein